MLELKAVANSLETKQMSACQLFIAQVYSL